MKLYDYQQDLVNEGLQVLNKHKLVLLALEMRVGKTPISLTIARDYGAKQVLFITKKKVITEIETTFSKLRYDYKLEVINYESLHKVKSKPDLVIIDECHRLGAYPKPGLATRQLKSGLKNLPVIFLSGTPTPESWSQIYHIMYVSNHSPFSEHKNFYSWHKKYGIDNTIFLGQQQIKDYSIAKIDLIDKVIAPYRITRTQEQAGFEVLGYEEIIHKVPMSDTITKLINVLHLNKLYVTKDGKDIIADTPAKLMSKHHQLSAGTVITEDKSYINIDDSKAIYISNIDNINNIKFAIYYIYKSELNSIFNIFKDRICTDVEKFNQSVNGIYVSQVVSGREGINLSICDDLFFYNIPHSYVSWSQTIARIQSKTKTRPNRIHYLIPELGQWDIESKILKTVKAKEDFTSKHYLNLRNI